MTIPIVKFKNINLPARCKFIRWIINLSYIHITNETSLIYNSSWFTKRNFKPYFTVLIILLCFFRNFLKMTSAADEVSAKSLALARHHCQKRNFDKAFSHYLVHLKLRNENTGKEKLKIQSFGYSHFAGCLMYSYFESYLEYFNCRKQQLKVDAYLFVFCILNSRWKIIE